MSVAKKRMWFNADRTKLVEEGDPDAAFLAAAVGQEIPDIPNVETKKGLVVEKEAAKAPNKAAKADEDK